MIIFVGTDLFRIEVSLLFSPEAQRKLGAAYTVTHKLAAQQTVTIDSLPAVDNSPWLLVLSAMAILLNSHTG